MATKSNRSSGTQVNQRGVAQGNTLVGPHTGLPIDEVLDNAGVRRLAVDANITAQNIQVEVKLDYNNDSVQLGDPNTESTLRIETNGSINTNVAIDATDGDNLAIHDSQGDELAVNSDGSINVNVVQSNSGVLKSIYNEVGAVATTVLTSLVTYTVPLGKIAYIQIADLSGTNIAEYTMELNSVIQTKKRTYFGGNLDTEFKFAISGTGLPIVAGDVVVIKVIHNRPDVGVFNARLQILEV